MKSSTESSRTFPKSSDFKFKVFCCDLPKSKLVGTNALKYIEWGEKNDFHLKPTTKARNLWYSLGDRKEPPIISPSGVNEIYRAFVNQEKVRIDKVLYELYPVKGFERELAAVLNSTYTSFMIELGGRTGLGQGLLYVAGYELMDILIPDLGLLSGLNPMNRKIGSLEFEMQQQDRIELDAAIFDVIGLTYDERKQLYESYIKLVSNRIGKSTTITSPIN